MQDRIKKGIGGIVIVLLVVVLVLQQGLTLRSDVIFRSYDKAVEAQIQRHDYESAYYELNHAFNRLSGGILGHQDWHSRKQVRKLRKQMNTRIDSLLPLLDATFPRGMAGDWRSVEELEVRYDTFITWFSFRITRSDKATDSIRDLLLKARGLNEVPSIRPFPESSRSGEAHFATSYPVEIDNNYTQILSVRINGCDKGSIAPGHVMTLDVPIKVPNIAQAEFFISGRLMDSISFKPGRDTVLTPGGKGHYVVVSQNYIKEEFLFKKEPRTAKIVQEISGEFLQQIPLGLCSPFPKVIKDSSSLKSSPPFHTVEKLYRKIPEKLTVNQALKILESPRYYFFGNDRVAQKKVVRVVRDNVSRSGVRNRICALIKSESARPIFLTLLEGQEHLLSEELLDSWVLGSTGEPEVLAKFATVAWVLRGDQFHVLELLHACSSERWAFILSALNDASIANKIEPELRGKIILLAIQKKIAVELASPLLDIFWENTTLSEELILALDDFKFSLKWKNSAKFTEVLGKDWADRIDAVMIQNLSGLSPHVAKKIALRYLDANPSKEVEIQCVEFLVKAEETDHVLSRYSQLYSSTRHAVVYMNWKEYKRSGTLSPDLLSVFNAGINDTDSSIRYATFRFFEAIYYEKRTASILRKMEAAMFREKDPVITARMAYHVESIGGKVPTSVSGNPAVKKCAKNELKSLRGKPKEVVIQTLGRPTQFLRLGDRSIILYPFAQVELEHGRVISVSATR